MSNTPQLSASIIIPSLNSVLIGDILELTVGQVGFARVDSILVIGLDNANKIIQHEKVKFLNTKTPISAGAARNIGISLAESDILLFLDSDCLPAENWLSTHLDLHEKGHLIVGGGVIADGKNFWHKTYNLTIFHEYLSSKPASFKRHLPTLNLSIRSQVIQSVGEMDTTLNRGQDIEWTLRMRKAGFRLFFSPQACVLHQHNRDSLSLVWSDCARSGYFMRKIRRENKSHISAPAWLKSRVLILGLAPLIAFGVTTKIYVKNWPVMLPFLKYSLGVYLTKIAWCWGASRKQDPGKLQ